MGINRAEFTLSETVAWSPEIQDGNWLLTKWARWAKGGVGVQGFPMACNFAVVVDEREEVVSDDLAMPIELAVMHCSPPCRKFLMLTYIRNQWDGVTPTMLIPKIQEFLDVYQQSGN